MKNNRDTDFSRKCTQTKGNTMQEQLKLGNNKANADKQAVTKVEQQCSAWIACRSNLNHCVYSAFFFPPFPFVLLNKPLLLIPKKRKKHSTFQTSVKLKTLWGHPGTLWICGTGFSEQNGFAQTSVNVIDLHKNENIKINDSIMSVTPPNRPGDPWTGFKERSCSNSVFFYLRHKASGVMQTGNKQFRKWITWLVQFLQQPRDPEGILQHSSC